jgi:hypothetical protein
LTGLCLVLIGLTGLCLVLIGLTGLCLVLIDIKYIHACMHCHS